MTWIEKTAASNVKTVENSVRVVLSAVMARMRSAAVSAVVPVVIGMISVPAVQVKTSL